MLLCGRSATIKQVATEEGDIMQAKLKQLATEWGRP